MEKRIASGIDQAAPIYVPELALCVFAEDDIMTDDPNAETSVDEDLPEYFSDGDSLHRREDDSEMLSGTNTGLDLDYDGLTEATAGVQALQVTNPPATGSNGGGSV